VPLQESFPGSALEILFERLGGLLIGKRRVGDQKPRLEFIGVRRSALVVVGEALLQVVSKSDIVLRPLVYTFDEVDLSHPRAA
jgi:hypothetical protein